MAIINIKDLQGAIEELELKRDLQKVAFKQEWQNTKEALDPVNLIRTVVQNAAAAPDIRENIVNAGIGLGSGVLIKKLIVGKKGGFFKKLLGTAAEFGVANIVARNSDSIKEAGGNLIDKIFKKNKAHGPEPKTYRETNEW